MRILIMKETLLVNWDSYPNFASGGVYTWEKALIEQMPDWNFSVVNLLSNSNSNQDYTLPPNVKNVIELPIYGSTRYEEYYNDTSNLFSKLVRTRDGVVKKRFLPTFNRFLGSALSENCDPAILCQQVFELHSFFGYYDSKKCMEHPATWEAFVKYIREDAVYKNMSFRSAASAFQMIQRNIQLLSIEVPRTDIIHCSLAWLPSLIGIFGKMENNCPMIVTEHGVAFRELLMYSSSNLRDEPSKLFSKVFSENVVRAVYHSADFIAPVCNANAKWEQMIGAEKEKIRVIYNGVDTRKFRPQPSLKTQREPIVVYVGRIDPFKDILCLISAIKEVKKQLPSFTCLIFGAAIDLEYSIRCAKAVKESDLSTTVRFMGPIKQPERAYNLGDIVVSSSITEGFPFSVIEAMSCGKSIVATDVGGVREALEGCGFLVRSRRPKELASAIVTLAKSEKLRNEMGEASLRRARERFSLQQCIQNYRLLYEEALGVRALTPHSEMKGVIAS
jgi:glycosyltransferase involved in cell wall biosynthesis